MSDLQYYRREKLSGLNPEKPMFADVYFSNSASDTSQILSKQLMDMLHRAATPSQSRSIVRQWRGVTATSMVEALFEARSALKIMTSRIAMHLDDTWRRELFLRIDALLDADDWHAEDIILKPASFETYLRFYLHLRPNKTPNLGVSDDGNLLGGWITSRNRLSMEFLPSDAVRWVLVRYFDDERETAAAHVSVSRLAEVLAPYEPESWWS